MQLKKQIQEHKTHEINYDSESSVSHSQYSIYKSCPYQWYLSHVKKLNPKDQTIQTVFGTSIHETIQNYLNVMYNESITKADNIDLEVYLKERLTENYKKKYEETNVHFSSSEEMDEFYNDGCEILKYLKKNRIKFFTTKKTQLLGVEIPLIVKLDQSVYFKGFIDLVFYDESDDKIKILDIKTSRSSWTDNQKKDEVKTSQILLYKEYFSKQFNVDIDKIDVEFFIVKRKLWEKSDYPQSRVQTFAPASGKIKRKKVLESFNSFINDCFSSDGKPKDKIYIKTPSTKNCKYCPYSNKPELCDKKA